MKRDYSTSSKPIEGITFFKGVEIEHTPAFGKDTLFVVGMQDPEEVLELAMKSNIARSRRSIGTRNEKQY